MSTNRSEIVCVRLREERVRLGWSQQNIADMCEVHLKTAQRWELGVVIPADSLGLLGDRGVDVQYVCTGYRSVNSGQLASTRAGIDPTISPPEWKLIKRYRTLGEAQQSQAQAMLDVLAAGVPITGTGSAVVVKGSGNRVAGRNYVEHPATKPKPRTKG